MRGWVGDQCHFHLIAFSLTCKVINSKLINSSSSTIPRTRKWDENSLFIDSFFPSFYFRLDLCRPFRFLLSLFTIYIYFVFLYHWYTNWYPSSKRVCFTIFSPLIKLFCDKYTRRKLARPGKQKAIKRDSLHDEKIAHTCMTIFYYDYWKGKYIKIEGPWVIRNHASMLTKAQTDTRWMWYGDSMKT